MAAYDDDWLDAPAPWRAQPWASRGPRPRGSPGRTRREAQSSPGYDFVGYQGGELGRPVNARGPGLRGSYGTPRGRGGLDWDRGFSGYGGEYERPDTGFRGRYGASRGYRRGRGTEYGADFSRPQGGPPRGQRDFAGEDRWRGTSEDFGGHEHRHYGRTPPDRWPASESGAGAGRMSDDDVVESVRENLFQDTFVDPERIEVNARDGVVTLRGEVDDFLEARYAWDDAWESPGVRGVINHLTVRTDRASEEMDMPQTGGGESPTR